MKKSELHLLMPPFPASFATRLAVDGLACERGGRLLFAGLSLALEPGQGLTLTGANGVGKTSLLRILAGLLPPGDGTIALTGGDPEATLAEQAHFIGPREALKAAMTTAEHVVFWGNLFGARQAASDPAGFAGTVLERAGLVGLASTPAGHLSSGQRRRLALARLDAAPRPLWLLDEPFNALDARARDHLAARLDAHLKAGGIAIVATHVPVPGARLTTLDLARDMTGHAPRKAG